MHWITKKEVLIKYSKQVIRENKSSRNLRKSAIRENKSSRNLIFAIRENKSSRKFILVKIYTRENLYQ